MYSLFYIRPQVWFQCILSSLHSVNLVTTIRLLINHSLSLNKTSYVWNISVSIVSAKRESRVGRAVTCAKARAQRSDQLRHGSCQYTPCTVTPWSHTGSRHSSVEHQSVSAWQMYHSWYHLCQAEQLASLNQNIGNYFSENVILGDRWQLVADISPQEWI